MKTNKTLQYTIAFVLAILLGFAAAYISTVVMEPTHNVATALV
jgi:hypothetical protein